MPLTVAPLGVRCNIQCRYCYEDPMRDAGNLGVRYSRSDVDALKRSIAAHSRGDEPFLLFGGEPLLYKLQVLTTDPVPNDGTLPVAAVQFMNEFLPLLRDRLRAGTD